MVSSQSSSSTTTTTDSSYVALSTTPSTTSTVEVTSSAKSSSSQTTMLQIFIGGCAGVAAKTGVAPLERLKTIYQVNTRHNLSVWSGLTHMHRTEGVRGLFRGNLANCIKTAPTSAFKFLCYEKMKRFFAARDSELTNTQVFWAGSLSGIAAHVVFYPLDVIKTRLSATDVGTYRGMSHVVWSIVKNEKSIVPFFRGMSASIASTVPQSGIQLTVYEMVKHVLVPPTAEGDDDTESVGSMRTLMSLAVAGGSGALVSQAATYPLKTVKSRMIMQGQASLNGTLPTYNGMWDVCRKTMSTEGAAGFYKGFMPNLVKAVPSHCIAFAVYDSLKKLFQMEKRHKSSSYQVAVDQKQQESS